MRSPSAARSIAFALGTMGVASMLMISSSTSAQTTLLLRDDDTASTLAESGIDEGLREALGASVRRLEPSLEDLALAAGCETDPSDSSCIAVIAGVTDARLVVIEHGSLGAFGWRIDLDVRRGSDGERIRSIHLECSSAADCGSDLVAAFAPPDGPAATAPVARRTARSDETEIQTTLQPPPSGDEAARPVEPTPARHTAAIAPQALLVSAAVVGVGAIIAGGIGVHAGSESAGAGVIIRRDQVDHLVSLQGTQDWAMGLGTAFAITGACLAAGAVVALVLEADAPSLRVAGGTDGASGMLSVEGAF